jgi:outer membrane protein
MPLLARLPASLEILYKAMKQYFLSASFKKNNRHAETAAGSLKWQGALLALLLIVILPLCLQSQELLSPSQAVEIALENNYSIRIAKNQAKVAANNATYGNAGFLPTLDVGASQNYNIQNTRQEYLSGQINERDGARSNSLNLNAALKWTLFDGLAMFATYDKLKELEAMGELQARLAIERTLVNVLYAYYDLVRQKQRLLLLEKTITVSEERVRLAEEKFMLGAASRLEVLQAQVDYNADRSEMLTTQENFRTSKIRLNNLLARKLDIDFDVNDEISLAEVPAWGSVFETVMSANTLLQLSMADQRIAALQIREIEARRLPRLNANMGYNYLVSESESGFLLSNRTSGLNYGVSLAWNIFNGFNLNRQISNSRLYAENTEIMLTDYRASLEAALMSTWLSLQSKTQLAGFEAENLVLAELNLSIAMERFRLGELSGFELREAQKNYLAAEGRLISARYLAKLVEVDLLEISGALIQAELD